MTGLSTPNKSTRTFCGALSGSPGICAACTAMVDELLNISDDVDMRAFFFYFFTRSKCRGMV